MNKEIFTNENKGFSLVELIVVIAIMAVMTSVLAPSLLGYVEQSRMQKDDSAMGEVMNAIKLALADQDVYDECLAYNVKRNYSCYVDAEKDAFDASVAVEDKNRGTTAGTPEDVDDWHYDDTVRLKDETPYTPDGKMRGMTLTFTTASGTNTTVFNLAAARVNEVVKGLNTSGTTIQAADQRTLSQMSSSNAAVNALPANAGQLYNKLRAVIGDNITLSSQTYRNSEYTVFIRMGSTGGNDAGAQDAVAVYGQWNGTNLVKEADGSYDYGTDTPD